jgi:hypothetical protein
MLSALAEISRALRRAGKTAERDPKMIEERLVEPKQRNEDRSLPGERRRLADTMTCGALGASATEN